MSVDPTSKQPVRISIGYGFWVDDWAEPFIQRLHKSKREYIDFSGAGTGRMSSRMAQNFVEYLKNAIVSGTTGVAGHKEGYEKRRGKHTVGILTGEMYNSITAFRTNLGGEKKHRGWIVSIKEKDISQRGFPTWYKLSWLEWGTSFQKERPIIAKTFERYVGEGWVKKVVEDMLTRGMGKTAMQRAKYGGASDE